MLDTRKLGTEGLTVSAIGLGLMGMVQMCQAFARRALSGERAGERADAAPSAGDGGG